MNKNNEFKKQWKLSFKYLFIVMMIVVGLRTVQVIATGQGDSISIYSVIFGISIAFFGTAIVSFIIAWFGTKNS
jgi:hypothetical protein